MNHEAKTMPYAATVDEAPADSAMALFGEIGMHFVEEPDVLRKGRAED